MERAGGPGTPASSPGGGLQTGIADRRSAHRVPPFVQMARDSGNRVPLLAQVAHDSGTPDLLPFGKASRGRTGSPGEAGGMWRPGEIGAGVAASQRGVGGGGAISPGPGRRGAGTAVFAGRGEEGRVSHTSHRLTLRLPGWVLVRRPLSLGRGSSRSGFRCATWRRRRRAVGGVGRRRCLAACGQSHAAFPSQKGWWSGDPAPRPFRSGVCAVLAPRSGSPSQKGWWSGDPAPRPFRSGVCAVLAPRSGSPSQKGWWSGDPAPRPSRSGVCAVLAPRSGSPSQKGWWSGEPAPRPFRSGVCAVLAPRSGSDRRCIPAETRRFAPLIVALRSKYTRYSSLGRLVSRAPRPHRENWPVSVLTSLYPQAARAPPWVVPRARRAR